MGETLLGRQGSSTRGTEGDGSSRITKDNPVLKQNDESGVKGLAQMIVRGDVSPVI